jgi:hypothetical protein
MIGLGISGSVTMFDTHMGSLVGFFATDNL